MSIAIENQDKALEIDSSSSGTSVNYEVFREHYVSYKTADPVIITTSDITENVTISPKPVLFTVTSENPSDPSYPGDMIYTFFVNGIKVTDESAASITEVLEYSSSQPQTIKLIEGTKITYEVSRALYIAKTGTTTVNKTKTINVILDKAPVYFTLKVNPTPSSANVKLVAEGFKQINKQITVTEGTTVQVTVSNNYYYTHTQSITMTQDTTLTVSLTKIQYTLTVNTDPSDATVTFDKGTVSGKQTTVYADDATVKYTVSAPTFVTITKTITLTENTTVYEYLNYASGTVIFESSNAGTYTRTLRPGTYIIQLIGGGAGSARAHHRSHRRFHTDYDEAAVAAGGSSAYVKYNPFRIKQTSTVVIVIGAASAAGMGRSGNGTDSTLTINGLLIGTAGGGGGATAGADNGWASAIPGCGGVYSFNNWSGNPHVFGTIYGYNGLNGGYNKVVWHGNTVSVPNTTSPSNTDKGIGGGGWCSSGDSGSGTNGGPGYCKIVVA